MPTYVHEDLLYLLVAGDRDNCVVLPPEPGADGLQGTVRAAPAVVIKLVLRKTGATASDDKMLVR